MAIHGSLLTMPLSDLLQWVKTTDRAGSLVVSRDGSEWELELVGGTVTAYMGPELRDNLGYIVVTSGVLTEEDVRKAIQHQRAFGVSLRKALLARGMVTATELQACLEELVQESIYDLFINLPGEFAFSERSDGLLALDLDEEDLRLPLNLDINHLLMEGARRQDEWVHVRERFPKDDVRVRLVHERLPPPDKLSVRERRILASLSAGQTVSDICFELRAPIPSVFRILAAFEENGAIVIEDNEPHPQAPEAESASRVQKLLSQAVLLREAGQFEEAIALLEVAVRMRPDAEAARQALKDALGEQIKALYALLPPVKVPYLAATEERLRRIRLRPEERFLLERLSAQMDIGSLIMVSSLNERETLKTLKKFLHSGIVCLR